MLTEIKIRPLKSKSKQYVPRFNFKRFFCVGPPEGPRDIFVPHLDRKYKRVVYGYHERQNLCFRRDERGRCHRDEHYCQQCRDGLCRLYQNQGPVKRNITGTPQRQKIIDNIHEPNSKAPYLMQHLKNFTKHYQKPAEQGSFLNKQKDKKCKCEFYRRNNFTKHSNRCYFSQHSERSSQQKTPFYQHQSLTPCPSRNTDISTDLYNSFLSHFNKFFEEKMLHGLVLKSSKGNQHKMMSKTENEVNANVDDSKSENGNLWETENSFASCVKEVVDKTLFSNAETTAAQNEYSRKLGKKCDNSLSSVIIKVKCKDGGMKLYRLKSKSILKKSITHPCFRSTSTQTLNTTMNHAKKSSAQNRPNNIPQTRTTHPRDSFTTLAKCCFSSFISQSSDIHSKPPPKHTVQFAPEPEIIQSHPSTQIPNCSKKKVDSALQFILPDDYDTRGFQVKTGFMEPIVAVLKTTKKEYFKKCDNYYEIIMTPRLSSFTQR